MQLDAIHEWIHDGGTVATLGVLLGLYRKVSVLTYQHKLIWSWFKKEHDIHENGKGE